MRTIGLTELKWDGKNAEAMLKFTEGRSEVMPLRDGIPNVLVIHHSRTSIPPPEHLVTASAPRDAVPPGRLVTASAPRDPVVSLAPAPAGLERAPRWTWDLPASGLVLSARVGDTVMRSSRGTLYVRTPDGRFEGDHVEFLRDQLKEDVPLAAEKRAEPSKFAAHVPDSPSKFAAHVPDTKKGPTNA